MVGRELGQDEEVTVMVFPPGHMPSPAACQALRKRIKEILDGASQNMRQIPEEEVESAIDEAMAHVRPW